MKYKVGDILRTKNRDIETMITRIDKNDNTYYLSDYWETEHYLDENFELLTPHADSWKSLPEPLIKDEKIRKAVRAWAEVNAISRAQFDRCINGFSACGDGHNLLLMISFFDDFVFMFVDGKYYTIDELCGEEA